MARNELRIGGQGRLFEPVRNNLTKVKDKAIDGQAVYYIVKKYAELAGIERKISPQDCRAAAIENALEHSASLAAVQQMAGWASPAMLKRYQRVPASLDRSATHAIDY
jgi:site-specific recombinase XerD